MVVDDRGVHGAIDDGVTRRDDFERLGIDGGLTHGVADAILRQKGDFVAKAPNGALDELIEFLATIGDFCQIK